MNNKGDHTYNTIQVGEAFSIQPKNKVVDSYSGGKSANIKFVEPKKNKLFPFILIGILIVLGVLIYTVVNNTKEIERQRPTGPVATVPSKTTTETTTTIDVNTSEITNFNAYLNEIIGNGIESSDNYDLVIRYSGMYFEFSCSAYDEEIHSCLSGKGTLLLPEATITLFDFDDEEHNYIKNSKDLYLSLRGDKLMIVKCSDIPGKSSVIVYDLNGKLLFTRDNITTSYYSLDSFNNRLVPTLSVEDSPKTISFYECKKNNNSDVNVGSYNATISLNPKITEDKSIESDQKEAAVHKIRIVFSCTEPKK